MADNQKYYYMRLKENFFDTNEIVLLESMPDGYLYSNILLKLYLRSLKGNGKLMFNDRIPYNANMIATITRHQIGTVEKALGIFRDMGLIEVLENGAMYMLDIQSFIGESSTEAERKKLYRQRIKQDGGHLSRHLSDIRTPEIEIDIEKEIELEKEIKKNNRAAKAAIYFPNDEKLNQAFLDYIEMRKSIKAKMTDKAIDLAIKKLEKLSGGDNDKAIAILEQSIMNSWKGLFDIKQQATKEIDWSKV